MKKKIIFSALLLALAAGFMFAAAGAEVRYTASSVTVYNTDTAKNAKPVEGDVCIYLSKTVAGKVETAQNDEPYGPIAPGKSQPIHVPSGWTVSGASITTCRVAGF